MPTALRGHANASWPRKAVAMAPTSLFIPTNDSEKLPLQRTDREKLLMMLLPAVLVAGGYSFFFMRGKLTRESQLATEVAKTRAAAPSPDQLALQEARRAQLVRETQEIDASLKQAHQRIQDLIGACTDPARRNQRIERLTKLLTRHDLGPITDKAEAGRDSKVPQSLEPLAQRAAELMNGVKPHLLNLSFEGRYQDVYRVLEQLTQGEVLAIPLAVTMKSADDPERRVWSLLVWI
jgi:hypothetical protein